MRIDPWSLLTAHIPRFLSLLTALLRLRYPPDSFNASPGQRNSKEVFMSSVITLFVKCFSDGSPFQLFPLRRGCSPSRRYSFNASYPACLHDTLTVWICVCSLPLFCLCRYMFYLCFSPRQHIVHAKFSLYNKGRSKPCTQLIFSSSQILSGRLPNCCAGLTGPALKQPTVNLRPSNGVSWSYFGRWHRERIGVTRTP